MLDELHRRYQSLGFTVLGVNVEEDPRKAWEVLKDLQVSFPVLFDDQSTGQPGLEDVYQQQVRELIRE